MRKRYAPASAEVIRLSLEDILTSSGTTPPGTTVPDTTLPDITDTTTIPPAPDDPDLLEPML